MLDLQLLKHLLCAWKHAVACVPHPAVLCNVRYMACFDKSIVIMQYHVVCFTGTLPQLLSGTDFLSYTAVKIPTNRVLNCKLHDCRAAVDLKSAMLWCCGLTQTSASASVQSSQSSCPPHLVVPRHTGAKLFLCSGTA
jgi:hypothetical protein